MSKTKLFYKILWKNNLKSTNKNNEKYIVVVLSVSCDDRIWFFRLQSYSWYDFYFTTAGLLQCSLHCCGCFHENFQISHLWQAWKRENKIIFEVISSQSGREKIFQFSACPFKVDATGYPVQKNLPRKIELAWQFTRYLWRGTWNFKIFFLLFYISPILGILKGFFFKNCRK